MPTVRVLSFHAGYGCKHRGRCCTSGWPIAVEGAERTQLEAAIDQGLLTSLATSQVVARPGLTGLATSRVVARPGFEGRVISPTGPALLASTDGRCVFHDGHADGGCRIHRALGHAALPLACRQFPRQSVRDPRGVSVTLSHYCPTAHDLLVNATDPLTIVQNAPAFPAHAEYVGLTADSALPPLLHAKLAMDWESWWLFEELSLSLLSEAPAPLYRLALVVELARQWTVDQGPLSAHIRQAFVHARQCPISSPAWPESRIAELNAAAVASVPDEWRDIATRAMSEPASHPVDDHVTRRHLAAHAFANWAAYQGEGLRTWFRSVETAASLLAHTGDAGTADLILRHLADPTALVAQWNQAERGSSI